MTAHTLPSSLVLPFQAQFVGDPSPPAPALLPTDSLDRGQLCISDTRFESTYTAVIIVGGGDLLPQAVN